MHIKVKGKVIIGIAMAAIMVASVIAAMIGGIGAYSVGGAYNIIQKDMGATVQAVLIGQNVDFSTNWGSAESDIVTIYRVKEGVVEWTKKADLGNTLTIAGDDWRKAGAFFVNYNESDLTKDAWLSFSDPSMPLKLKVGTKEVSSIAVDTYVKIDTGGMNLFPEDRVDLVIISPDGQIKYDEINDQPFTNISVTNLAEWYGGSPGRLATKGWAIGDYTFEVKTKPEYACGLDAESAVKDLEILTEEIAIEADTTSAIELEQVTLTVTGVAGDEIEVYGESSDVVFKRGVLDTPWENAKYIHKYYDFTDTIDADGTRKYVVEFTDTGTYTIRAVVTGPIGNPRIGDYDMVDIMVSEKNVTFDVPSIAVIGDRITIKGTATSGTFVSVYVDDVLYRQLQDLVIEDGEFSKEVTTTNVGMCIPGTVRLKAWIDCECTVPPGEPFTTDKPTRSPDGSEKMFMVRPWLTAGLSPDSVDQEDEFTVEGTAPGSRQVNILCVAPEGGGGKSLLDKGVKGISLTKASVSTVDNTFSKKMTVQEDADSGIYYIIVLSPGLDGEWDMTGESDLERALDVRYRIPSLTSGVIHTKTQEDIVEILEDLTQCAGSDDLMRILTLKVGWIETLTLNPIADVVVGEPLEVSGNSSRKEGSLIWITVKGRYYEIVPQAAIAKDNTFSATFDTTGAQPGTYIVKANDGYGYTAVTSVNIVAETPPAPTSFDTGEGSYPSIMGTHNGTLMIQRM